MVGEDENVREAGLDRRGRGYRRHCGCGGGTGHPRTSQAGGVVGRTRWATLGLTGVREAGRFQQRGQHRPRHRGTSRIRAELGRGTEGRRGQDVSVETLPYSPKSLPSQQHPHGSRLCPSVGVRMEGLAVPYLRVTKHYGSGSY